MQPIEIHSPYILYREIFPISPDDDQERITAAAESFDFAPLFGVLGERQRVIIALRYCIASRLRPAVVAMCFGLSIQRIHQISDEALSRMLQLYSMNARDKRLADLQCQWQIRPHAKIATLELASRTAKILDHNGIGTVLGLQSRTSEELLGLTNFGPSALADVRDKLQALGLYLLDDALAPHLLP